MLKDRRALLEHEIAKLTQHCKEMYIDLAITNKSAIAQAAYCHEKDMLSDRLGELKLVNQMINDGHE